MYMYMYIHYIMYIPLYTYVCDKRTIPTQQLREQCLLRVLDMVVVCEELCDIINAIPNSSFTVKFDSRFSLTEKSTQPSTVETSLINSNNEALDNSVTQDLLSTRSEEKQEGKNDDPETELLSSDGEDMEGYESDTSSSSSGEDVVVEGTGDSEEGEEGMEEDEQEATVIANIEELKVKLPGNSCSRPNYL